jgi:hypothetical protein
MESAAQHNTTQCLLVYQLLNAIYLLHLPYRGGEPQHYVRMALRERQGGRVRDMKRKGDVERTGQRERHGEKGREKAKG